MLSHEAYEIGSVLITGGCSVNDLWYSAATEGTPKNEVRVFLKAGLEELCSKRLIQWSYEADYGRMAPVFPQQFSGATFVEFWDRCFANVESPPAAAGGDYRTLSVDPTDDLLAELTAYESAVHGAG